MTDPDIRERLRNFSAEVQAERKENAGPVERSIIEKRDEFVPAIEALQLIAMIAALGRELTPAEAEDFKKSAEDHVKQQATFAAIVWYLETEHERRAAWEKETEAKIMSCLDPRGAF